MNHDPILKKEPAYSMCKAERFSDRSDYGREFSAGSYYWSRPTTAIFRSTTGGLLLFICKFLK
jgi:hypothetical protein